MTINIKSLKVGDEMPAFVTPELGVTHFVKYAGQFLLQGTDDALEAFPFRVGQFSIRLGAHHPIALARREAKASGGSHERDVLGGGVLLHRAHQAVAFDVGQTSFDIG